MHRQSHLLVLFGSVLLGLGLFGCDNPPPTPDGGGMCVEGTAGCACIDGTMCMAELVCETGLCRGVDSIEIDVTDANARSCEVVVVEEQTEVLGVDFSAGNRGTHVHESPRTAVTFTRETDTAFPAGSVLVRRSESPGASLTLRLARCFDRDGNVLGGEPLRLVN